MTSSVTRRTTYLFGSLLVLSCCFATGARAQTSSLPPNDEPAAAPTPLPGETPVPDVEPNAPTLLESPPPSAAEPLIPVPAPETATTLLAIEPLPAPPAAAEAKADKSGFALSSGGEKPAFTIKFKLTLQADNRKFLNDDRSKDTLLIRRVRPILDGTVLGLVDYRVMPDFAGSQAALYDAFLDIHPLPWLRLRTGKFKAPVGLERLQGDPDLPFMERAYTANLSSTRDVGVELWGDIAGGVLNYAVGVFNGAPDNANPDIDTGAQKELIARVFLQPFKAPGLESAGNLGIGIAGSVGRRDGSATSTQLSPLRSIGQQQVFGYLASTTDATATVFARGRHTRLNPELYYYIGPFGILSEIIWSQQRVQRGTGDAKTLLHRAWHATASYVIGGKNGFDGATPNSNWDPSLGQLGALEIGVRYHELTLDDDTFPTFASADASVREARGFGVSLDWALSRTFRLMTGFEHSWFKAGRSNADRKNEDVWLSRAQVNF
jgi:phosphate-selective porin OprO/OprP